MKTLLILIGLISVLIFLILNIYGTYLNLTGKIPKQNKYAYFWALFHITGQSYLVYYIITNYF